MLAACARQAKATSAGANYLFAAAARNGSTTATFSLKPGSSSITIAEPIGEDERANITIVNGVFRDDFDSYGVHLYRLH